MILGVHVNTWNPPELSEDIRDKCIQEARKSGNDCYFAIIQVEPYVDALYVILSNNPTESVETVRFTFKEEYCWNEDAEYIFEHECLLSDYCGYSFEAMMEVYKLYSVKHLEWNLKRYNGKGLRLLDHIYHCMRKSTAKEVLYKAGLDDLAVSVNWLDELDLLAGSPSQVYGGVSMRALRALNCEYGAMILSTNSKREFIKQLQMKFPDLFKGRLNDAQCRYLDFLITGDLTVNEVGRLFSVRFKRLAGIWSNIQYQHFMDEEKSKQELEEFTKIDPIYAKYLPRRNPQMVEQLREYLLYKREDYDKKIRRVNRFHDSSWQERDDKYMIRYPQTINDFCREAVYMGNCLLTYVEPYTYNDTIILLMRKIEDINTPFITLEIFDNELQQAYGRYNTPINEEEAQWIEEYCDRHGIGSKWLSEGIY